MGNSSIPHNPAWSGITLPRDYRRPLIIHVCELHRPFGVPMHNNNFYLTTRHIGLTFDAIYISHIYYLNNSFRRVSGITFIRNTQNRNKGEANNLKVLSYMRFIILQYLFSIENQV